jgi:hypothetical protein
VCGKVSDGINEEDCMYESIVPHEKESAGSHKSRWTLTCGDMRTHARQAYAQETPTTPNEGVEQVTVTIETIASAG